MKKEKKKDNRLHGQSTVSKRQGRPRLVIDEDQIFKLAQWGMTDREMASILEISLCTLNNFRPLIQKARSDLSKSIKRTQLELAINDKDKTMLIWVGKQYCGQSEKVEQNSDALIMNLTELLKQMRDGQIYQAKIVD